LRSRNNRGLAATFTGVDRVLPALPRLDSLDFESRRPASPQPERDRMESFSAASPRIIACATDLTTRVTANRKAQFEVIARSSGSFERPACDVRRESYDA